MSRQGYITPEEVRQALLSVYRGDPESDLQKAFLESLSNELKPADEKGRWRPSPLFVLVLIFLDALAGVFLYFSIGGRQ